MHGVVFTYFLHLLKKIFLSKKLREKKIMKIMAPSNSQLQVFYILSGKNSKKWFCINKAQQQNMNDKKGFLKGK